MSEAPPQKLILAMTCVFGVVLVLIGYGRQRDRGFERLPLESSRATAARPTTPIPSRDQQPATGRIATRADQNPEHWQSMPATARASSNANFAPASQLPANGSSYEQQSSIGNYFNPSSALESQAAPRHPSAQKIALRNHQWQQSPHRASPQPTRQPVLQTRQEIQFHDLGNVRQTAATQPIVKQISGFGQSTVEARIPEHDLFTVQKQLVRDATPPQAKSVLNTQSADQFGEAKTTDQPATTYSLSLQAPQVSQNDIAAKIPTAEATTVGVARGVRKANWTEIDVTPKVDPMSNFRPLQQQTLPPRRANPQVESAAREQIQYGQSLARRRAYYAAREEFIRALLSIASSYNAESNSNAYPERLAQGLIALDELGDFQRANGSLLQQKILSHKSRLLAPQDIATTSSMQAIGLYGNFAQSQIEQAIGFSAAGSEALHALGKLESMVPEAESNQIKKLILYRAASKINPSNAVCANDLGVLLFDMGQLEASETALITAIGSAQSQLSWNNLALVHHQRAVNANSGEERNRQLSLAKLAAQQAEKFTIQPGEKQANRGRLNSDQWASPNDFQNNAAFPDDIVQRSDSRSSKNISKPAASRSATLKQKMKDWF